MVARARALRADDGSICRRSDLETLDLPRAAFEFACSSPALHDVAALARVVATLYRVLVPGSRFVASIEYIEEWRPTAAPRIATRAAR